MKKFFGLVMSLLLVMTVPVIAVQAQDDSSPLYKYVKNADGSYSYDESKPVYMYNGSTEQVMIPDTYTAPKRQFRTAWVATIANLNMPKVQSQSEFETKYTEILNTFSDWNMNAMIFQVRPLLDSYYQSEINPWSEFLSGQQGVDPGYDPLPWMIEETHARGMEFHAWFNPYRVTNTKLSTQSILNAIGMTKEDALAMTIPEHVAKLNEAGILADNNFAVLHPEWVLRFDEKLFLNPGIPEVRQNVIDSITEVINNYDVDAIHFDDYFYPYRITVDGQNVFFGDVNEDRETFETYGIPAGYSDDTEGIESWRRDNVTALIEGIKTEIDSYNGNTGSSVQFGISPFGIWEHKEYDERGSNTPTGSSESYSKSIFADTYKWIKDETLDYVIPQIYWSFDQAAAPYGELTSWWDSVVDGTRVQLYIGHANYKHVGNGGWEPAWMNPEEIPNQLKFNQQYENVAGSALFSYNDIMPSNVAALPADQQAKNQAKNDALTLIRDQYFSTPALSPAKPWLASAPMTVLRDGYFDEASSNSFTWQDDSENARYYVVYRGQGEAADIINDPANIIAKVWREDGANSLSFTDESAATLRAETTYVVTALDAAHNETPPLVIQARAGSGSTDNNSGNGTSSENGSGGAGSELPQTGENFAVSALLGVGIIVVAGVVLLKRKAD
ncbi:glycoside hydrolase family 10 protein [Culicoidibacter larvae]|uniref:LPXTG cell wall anchor domain-containing protein n=1 Tax=Culicoidibacter larvae TaxID=2579976 RepID=A0A5R8QGG6_9FIRM|nr:family 10 glycosylhydrolase [Culicoidibacter larvae]TLG76810.1 LPXTG cell wall anchor domain-containing protein [Culicoidibacter larvae]